MRDTLDVARDDVDVLLRVHDALALAIRAVGDVCDRAGDLGGGLCHLVRPCRELLRGGGKLLGGARNLTDDVTDVLHHRVEVRGELSELILRGNRKIVQAEVALREGIDVVHQPTGRPRDGRGKVQEGKDDARHEQDADEAQHAVGRLEACELCEGDALGHGNGDNPAGGGHGRIGDDLLLAVLFCGEIAALVLQHRGEIFL